MTWRDRAECSGSDPDLFFPSAGGTPAQIRKAKAICDTCPVTVDCLDYQLQADTTMHSDWGIWGGTGPRERRLIRRSVA